MKVNDGSTGMAMYKSVLDMQKDMMNQVLQMMPQQNSMQAQMQQQQQQQQQTQTPPPNPNGNISIYA